MSDPLSENWRRVSILIERDDEGRYVVECIDLPGCMSEGETLEEAIDNINEAIVGCLRSRLRTASEKIFINALPSHIRIDLDIPGISNA
ncbi:type II toxin-antitoxin system HicB family antitoxin [Methanocalculus taiwanensis]|uniref:Type II toxin-antitoxin system HicB family antitoxin n=1 Tax=Methanocalculus taiwanensis TaxID=106207 RepID=A0ABD4TGA4_9EURY|nr:type II toxin-antitoxin system HicB family antitoxin [Methanocalculus taiwanensis]